jgi:phosphate transport system substrate-binding protein
MLSKPVTDDDRKKYPKVNFVVTEIGRDAVALIVSADVYNGGVRALSKQQARDIYEGKITNWKAVGGPDRRIVFFNKEPGRGTWEQFAHWAYGDAKKAPRVSHPEVGGNEETRNKVAGTKGAISQLSASWAVGNVKALGIRLDDGSVVQPTAAEVVSGRYPMARPLFFVTNGPPRGEAKTFIDYVLSARGQELVRKHGYLRLADLKVRKDASVAAKRK